METNGSVRASAPYGQACAACSRAKCKCIRHGVSKTCERCHRLGRDCQPSTTVRKLTTSSARSAVKKTAQLEHKLDHVITLLRCQAEVNSGTNTSATSSPATLDSQTPPEVHTTDLLHLNKPKAPTEIVETDRTRATTHALDSSRGGGSPVAGADSGRSPIPSLISSPAVADLSLSQAEDTLLLFRKNHLNLFPFMYLPPEVTAHQLQHERPFLWLSIRASCAKSARQQGLLFEKVRAVAAQRIMVDSARNMDLLLGLITVVGWSMHYARKWPFITLFTNTAIAIASDLHLDRPSPENHWKESSCFRNYPYYRPPPVPTGRSHEERRAVLACFIVSSTNSSFMWTQSMRWTSRMDEALTVLSNTPEHPGDEMLVALVQIYKIMEEISQISWLHADQSAPHHQGPPPMPYIRGLRLSLENVKRTMSAELLQNQVILSHIYMTEVLINDLPLNGGGYGPQPTCNLAAATSTTRFPDTTYVPAKSDIPPPRGPATANEQLQRNACFSQCLMALRACLSNFLSFAPASYVGFPLPLLLHFSRCTQTLYRLNMIDYDADCDRDVARATVDLPAVLRQVADKFMQVAPDIGLHEHEDGGDGEGLSLHTKAGLGLRVTADEWDRAIKSTAEMGGEETGSVDAGPAEGNFVEGAGRSFGQRLGTGTGTGVAWQETWGQEFLENMWHMEMFTGWDNTV